MKLPEGAVGRRQLDRGLGNDCFAFDTKSTNNKSKNQQVRLHQTDTSVRSKRINKMNRTNDRTGENHTPGKRVTPRVCKELVQLNSETDGLVKTRAEELNRHFFREEIRTIRLTDTQKDLNATNHQGNANRKRSEMSPHPRENGCRPKETMRRSGDPRALSGTAAATVGSHRPPRSPGVPPQEMQTGRSGETRPRSSHCSRRTRHRSIPGACRWPRRRRAPRDDTVLGLAGEGHLAV